VQGLKAICKGAIIANLFLAMAVTLNLIRNCSPTSAQAAGKF
tara:strand:- start:302 stop:427 length:126 start_codon:yes stop_codon:yes gene_type:complete